MANIFSSILEKLGIHKPAVPATPAAPAKPTVTPPAHYVPGQGGTTPPTPPKPSNTYYTPGQNYPQAAPAKPIPPKPAEMPMVDVVAHLDYLAKTGPIQGLNWRMSINDLMALLGLDHSPQAIKDLAVELGCPEKEMGDSYSRNVWTHQTLLKKIAENGGNIPQELLH
jgi:Domain of unknown function (DUF3597)